MALGKDIVSNMTSATSKYHRVRTILHDCNRGVVIVTIESYVDKKARDTGKNPIEQSSITLDYDPSKQKVGNESVTQHVYKSLVAADKDKNGKDNPFKGASEV